MSILYCIVLYCTVLYCIGIEVLRYTVHKEMSKVNELDVFSILLNIYS